MDIAEPNMIPNTHSMDRPVDRAAPTARRRQRKGLLFLIAGLLLAAGFFTLPAFSRWARSDRSVDRAALRLAKVTRGDFARDVAVEGRIVAAQSPTAFSPARGNVRLAVQAGQMIEAGQLLATVESPELQSQLQQERSQLQSLQAEHERQRLGERQQNLENAQQVDLTKVRMEAGRRALGRAQRNFDEGVIGAVDFEKAQDDLRIAELELALAEKRATLDGERLAFETNNYGARTARQQLVVGELERQVKELEVRSPVAGQVGRVDVKDRDAVLPGQVLVSVVDLSAFEVEIGVPEAYAPQVELGMAVEIRHGSKLYRGVVRTLSAEVSASVVNGRVAFADGMPPDLKQSQRVVARLLFEAKTDVLLVERGPFLESGGGNVAWVVEDGIARPRRIETGAVGVGQVEILSGLQLGEEIVISETARFAGAEAVLLR
jgi:HlyD family secretion protein